MSQRSAAPSPSPSYLPLHTGWTPTSSMVEEELGEQQRVHTWRSDSLTVYTPPPRYVYLFLLLCLMRLPFYRFQGSSSLEETPDPSIHWSSTPTEVEVEVVTPASFSSSLTYESVQPGTPAPNQLAVRSCTVTPPIYSPQATQWSGGVPHPYWWFLGC
jgi:hypothetical protein